MIKWINNQVVVSRGISRQRGENYSENMKLIFPPYPSKDFEITGPGSNGHINEYGG
jgi:hypothetical protein